MFEVSFKNANAKEEVVTPKGNKVIHHYVLFIDQKGVHILAREGAVYLTPENSRVVD